MRGGPARIRLAMPSGRAMAHSGQAIGGSCFRATMPSTGHFRPSCLAAKIASNRGHPFAFSGAFQQLLCRVHRCSPDVGAVQYNNSAARAFNQMGNNSKVGLLGIGRVECSAGRAPDCKSKNLIGLRVHQHGVTVAAAKVRRVIGGVKNGGRTNKGPSDERDGHRFQRNSGVWRHGSPPVDQAGVLYVSQSPMPGTEPLPVILNRTIKTGSNVRIRTGAAK
jgi:hypothetical protein